MFLKSLTLPLREAKESHPMMTYDYISCVSYAYAKYVGVSMFYIGTLFKKKLLVSFS